MSQDPLEKHESLVIEMGSLYLTNMEFELGKKYQNNDYQIDGSLSETQYSKLKADYGISDQEFADLYSDFQKMKPTQHLKMAMDAFTASGGNVDIEPRFDEETQRLHVDIEFVIKDKKLDKIEGLSDLEHVVLKMNALLQIDTLLSGSDSSVSPSF